MKFLGFLLTILILGAYAFSNPLRIFAATDVSIISAPQEAALDTPFDIQIKLQAEPKTVYYLKARLGASSRSLTRGLTHNPANQASDDWLTDQSKWTKFPTAETDEAGSWQGPLQIKAQKTATLGSNLLFLRTRKTDTTKNIDSSGKTITLTPLPSISPSQLSASSPSPTPSSQPTITPQPSAQPIFGISSTPSAIKSDQSFQVTVQLTNLEPNQIYFLKGAFIREDSKNYFGLTRVGDSWVKNNQPYSLQLAITTDATGSWNGSLETTADLIDSGFTGGGTYLFKIARYTREGKGPVWSNQVPIEIAQILPSADSPQEITTEEETLSSDPPKPLISLKPSPKVIKNSLKNQRNLPNLSSVAGISTGSPKTTLANAEKRQFKPNWLMLAGGTITLIAGAGLLVKTLKSG